MRKATGPIPFEDWEPVGEREELSSSLESAFDGYMHGFVNARMARHHLVEHFGFAVPTVEAIMAIAELDKPVVEMGAGTGYWAWMLEQAGVDVIAYDKKPGPGNFWFVGDPWTDVRIGTTGALRHHSDRALLLCWPPPNSEMASNCLRYYRGDTLIYVGEWWGCCANSHFFDRLRSGWTEEREVYIPQWTGLHDYMSILRR